MNKINIPLLMIIIVISVVGIILIQSYESQYQKKKFSDWIARNNNTSDTLPKEPLIKELQEEYKTYTLDQCEYIVVGKGQYRWGTHKGDCHNTDHITETNRVLRDSIQKLYEYNKQLIQNNEYMSTRLAQIDCCGD